MSLSTEELGEHVQDIDRRLQNVEQNMATKADVERITSSIEDLLEAWNTAAGLLKFIKWGAGLGAAVLACWAAIKQVWP